MSADHEKRVEELAAKRYAEETIRLGPCYTMPHATRRYRTGFYSLAEDNWLRMKYVRDARRELEA